MNKEKITKLADSLKNKPEMYHFVCYGGSSTRVVDKWSTKNKFKCRYRGEKNWTMPACEKCDGLLCGDKTLTDSERLENIGIEKLFEASLAQHAKTIY